MPHATCYKLLGGGLRRRVQAPLKGKSGLTLIEILISIVILAVGILGVTAMQTASMGGELLSRNLDSCVNTVSDALDRIQVNAENISEYKTGGALVIDPQNPSPPSGTTALNDYNAIMAKMADVTSGGMQMQKAKLTITFQSDFPLAGVDSVTASMTWDRKGKTETCQVTNLVYKP
ncbi:MAG: prepilin-type N-terminal cleavage/methylation domain-containing protein [Nitrospinae bacterium]|nr:prepilin-type N-terminal cleavage/methylation domain-containing protein [Nitrospinota bacterium]